MERLCGRRMGNQPLGIERDLRLRARDAFLALRSARCKSLICICLRRTCAAMPHNVRMDYARYSALGVFALALIAFSAAYGEEKVQLDPFGRATQGFPACPEQPPPLLTAEQARTESHVRVERGLRCAMDGKCEAGGAYKRDPDLNEQIRKAIGRERRFDDTSIWVTTSRRWVTLQGCVHSAAQRKALVAFVAKQRGVERVFDELSTMASHKPAH